MATEFWKKKKKNRPTATDFEKKILGKLPIEMITNSINSYKKKESLHFKTEVRLDKFSDKKKANSFALAIACF